MDSYKGSEPPPSPPQKTKTVIRVLQIKQESNAVEDYQSR